jgi:glyoxylase-like metal-dependent hydrolase (beta-lactamase superfamily II)
MSRDNEKARVADAPQPSLQQIGDGVHAWIGANGDSNAGAIEAPDGILVVDAQQNVRLARSLRTTIEQVSRRPVGGLINTHFHLDHTAGNIVFADVPILAHEHTLGSMREYLGPERSGAWTVSDAATKLRLFFGSNIQELVPPNSPDEAWFRKRISGPDYDSIVLKAPSKTLGDRLTLALTSDILHVEYRGPAHCDGDLVLRLERQKVAFLGDLMFVGRFPWFGDCDLDGWIARLDEVLELDLAAVVPGHGPVATLRDVANFRGLLASFREAVTAAIKAGASEDAAVSDIQFPQYAEMPRYREWMPFNVRATYRYLKAG